METENNIIYIGQKPMSKYVYALQHKNANKDKTVIIQARGKNISRAVDLLEISKDKIPYDVDIKTSTCVYSKNITENGKHEKKLNLKVSSIRIELTRIEASGQPKTSFVQGLSAV
jgi:DNA-binding protein